MAPIGAARAGLMGGGVAIPDTDVYLHDDFGDGDWQNRSDGGTTTYHGVTGYYRPEWTLEDGNASPTVTNQELVPDGNGAGLQLSAPLDNIPVDNYSTTWDVELFARRDSSYVYCFSPLYVDSNNYAYFREMGASASTPRSEFNLIASGTEQFSIEGVSVDDGSYHDVRVTRSTSGQWELIIDGSTQGNATYSPLNNGNFGVLGPNGDTAKYRSIKVY